MSDVYTVDVDPAAENNPHSYAIRLTGDGHRVLEVGCSTGYVTEHLVAAGNTVVGVELDADAAVKAEQWAERVHVADLDRVALSDVEHGPFDVIMAGDVLEHLTRPDEVLADLVTLLSPDGRLIISVPNVAHIDIRLMLLDGRWTYQDTGLLDRTHVRWFTRESLRELLAGVGFVATRLERVIINPFTSGLDVSPDQFDPDVVRYLERDPEALTFQYVVEASRTGRDVLERQPDTPIDDWTLVASTQVDEERARFDALTEHNAALHNELEAWRNSRLARYSSPLRRVWAKVRRT